MYRSRILYGKPNDVDAFDRYDREVHLPLARRMNGSRGWTMNWIRDIDGEAPYRLVVDLYAQDRATMMAVLDSPEGRAAASDVANFATGGVSYLHGSDEVILPVETR